MRQARPPRRFRVEDATTGKIHENLAEIEAREMIENDRQRYVLKTAPGEARPAWVEAGSKPLARRLNPDGSPMTADDLATHRARTGQ